MRFLADENFPGPIVWELRNRGHDVLWAKEVQPGAKDEDILSRAMVEERVLATFHKDFGQLAFQAGLPAACGIILVRMRATVPELDNRRAIEAILARDDYRGLFAVIEDDRVRMRPLAEG